MASMADDPRVQWIGNKACLGLSVEQDLFFDLLESSLNVRSLLSKYLDAERLEEADSSLLIYLTIVEEAVPVKAAEVVPGPEPEPEAEEAAEVDGENREVGVEGADEAAAGQEWEGPNRPSEEAGIVADAEKPSDEAGAANLVEQVALTGGGGAAPSALDGEERAAEEGKAASEVPERNAFEPEQIEEIKVEMRNVLKMGMCTGLLPKDAIISRCFFIIRSRAGALDLSGLFELQSGLLVGGATLGNMEQVLLHVYLPLLLGPGKGDLPNAGIIAAEEHNETLSSLQKFISQVGHTKQQLSGDIQLAIPDVQIGEVDQAMKDQDLVASLEAAMAEWAQVLASAVQAQSEKGPVGSSPLAEIEFWRERNSALSSLFEQLNLPQARKIMAVVEAASEDQNLLTSFKAQFTELTKLCVEARDNVKFLTTLERHFKNIANGPLGSILDTLPPMMNALRMVWIISRHYKDDARMGSLFARIANEIGNRCEMAIDVSSIFRLPATDAVQIIEVAKSVLDGWFTVYMRVREIIEQGRDARWEFPRPMLFDRTSYMSEICTDLVKMVEILDDFYKFLGPELKSVTGDTEGIDTVIARVQSMVMPVESLPFRIFDRERASEWAEVKTKFYEENEKIKVTTRELIDTSFRKLRSAEGAFELFLNFKKIQSKGAIQQQMMSKFVDILEQFSREIDLARDIFETNKDNPPLTRNQPPVAGAIKWSRSVFSRVKHTFNSLRVLPPPAAATGVSLTHPIDGLTPSSLNDR